MISAIFGAVTNAVTAFAGSLSQAVTSVTNMFYDSTANSGAGELTVLGTLILIAVGVGLVYWSFRLIYRLINRA